MSNNAFMKPLITGALVVAGDKFLMKEQDMTKSLYFGVATTAGVYTASMIASALPVIVPSGGFVDGKTLEIRLAEISIGAGAAYALNRLLLKNDYQYSQMINKLGLIAGADFIAEYVTDYLENRPLSFFA
jgi:hypothetical protein